jgi:hypothetical protein
VCAKHTQSKSVEVSRGFGSKLKPQICQRKILVLNETSKWSSFSYKCQKCRNWVENTWNPRGSEGSFPCMVPTPLHRWGSTLSHGQTKLYNVSFSQVEGWSDWDVWIKHPFFSLNPCLHPAVFSAYQLTNKRSLLNYSNDTNACFLHAKQGPRNTLIM